LNEYQVYEHDAVHVTAGDVVIDVGGHLGMFTLEALAKGAGEVVVFEPEPTNVDCLKKTFQTQIAEGRVVLVDAAAWEEQGTLKFSTGSEDAGSGSARGQVSDGGEIVVRADTIDAVVERLGLSRVDFIKMDIEGAERHALAGARRTIEKFGPKMALCVYHREDDPEVLPAVVTSERADYTIEAGEGVRSGQIYCWRRGAEANPGL
jgi:FkbM family methyltransferase